jgi:hypothetical protein
MGHQLDLFRPTVSEALLRAYERIDAGLVDETGRERAEGPRKTLTKAQRKHWKRIAPKIIQSSREGNGAPAPSSEDASKSEVESRPLGVPPAAGAPIPPACTSWHGEDACCTLCTSTTCGRGFPHPSEAQGRKRYQQCSHCSDWVEPEHWVHDIRGAWFGCSWCAYYLNHASDDTRQLSSGRESDSSR